MMCLLLTEQIFVSGILRLLKWNDGLIFSDYFLLKVSGYTGTFRSISAVFIDRDEPMLHMKSNNSFGLFYFLLSLSRLLPPDDFLLKCDARL